MSGSGLDPTGMVTDFRHLEWLKKFINEMIDHQFIIDRNDPLYDKIVGNDKQLIPVTLPGRQEYVVGNILNLENITPGTPDYEYYEGIFVVDFVPTSENLSRWMADLVDFKMKELNVAVTQIDWWETPKSRSTYKRDPVVFTNGIRM